MRHPVQAGAESGACFVADAGMENCGLAYRVVLQAARSFDCGTDAMWKVCL
jgi:hypothetical protein